MTPNIGFDIKVVTRNVLKFKADVLALKYTQAWTTLTKTVVDLLPANNVLLKNPPTVGDWEFIPSKGVVGATSILFVGIPPRSEFDYDTIHELSRLTLQALSETDVDPPVHHLAVTMHGAGWGFDEEEAFRAMLLGFVTAVEDDTYPHDLKLISVVENHANRATVLKELLAKFLSSDDDLIPGKRSARSLDDTVRITPDSPEPAEPIATLDEPSIFVAMPFAKKYDDAYYLAIQPAIKELEYQCIRLDQSPYTGDVIDTIKSRIRAAKLVIALLDGANPNVFLEIGYAWGVGVPTMLIVNASQLKDGETGLPFDVRSQKYLTYELLHELKSMLSDELLMVLKGKRQKSEPKPKRTPHKAAN